MWIATSAGACQSLQPLQCACMHRADQLHLAVHPVSMRNKPLFMPSQRASGPVACCVPAGYSYAGVHGALDA